MRLVFGGDTFGGDLHPDETHVRANPLQIRGSMQVQGQRFWQLCVRSHHDKLITLPLTLYTVLSITSDSNGQHVDIFFKINYSYIKKKGQRENEGYKILLYRTEDQFIMEMNAEDAQRS
jgi:hypothetical protein